MNGFPIINTKAVKKRIFVEEMGCRKVFPKTTKDNIKAAR
jgi:hypothetical protein